MTSRTDTERLDALEKVPTHLRRLMLVGCEDRKWYVDSGQAGVLFRPTLRSAIDAYLDAQSGNV